MDNILLCFPYNNTLYVSTQLGMSHRGAAPRPRVAKGTSQASAVVLSSDGSSPTSHIVSNTARPPAMRIRRIGHPHGLDGMTRTKGLADNAARRTSGSPTVRPDNRLAGSFIGSHQRFPVQTIVTRRIKPTAYTRTLNIARSTITNW